MVTKMCLLSCRTVSVNSGNNSLRPAMLERLVMWVKRVLSSGWADPKDMKIFGPLRTWVQEIFCL